MDSKKSGGKKLQLSKDTIRELRVRTDVRTGFGVQTAITCGYCPISGLGNTKSHSNQPTVPVKC